MLGNDDETRAALRLHELAEVPRHSRLVVRDQDTTVASGEGEDFQILETCQARCGGGLKSMAGTRLSTADTMI